MKILKNFDSYIKEDLEPQTMPAPSTSPSPAPTIDPGTRPARPERPSPIRRDRPAVEPDPQANMVDHTEEEESDDVYFGKKMMDELAEALGTEVVNNMIEYNGKKINFYSETEKFHVDKKKFSTVEEVLDYLGEGETSMETDETPIIDDEMNDMDENEFETGMKDTNRGGNIQSFESFKEKYDKDDDDCPCPDCDCDECECDEM